MKTAEVLGLLATTALAATSFVLPAAAQQRVCVESESNGRVVCGRLVNESRYGNDRYGNDRFGDRYNNDRYSNVPSSFDERFYLTAYPDVAAAVAQRRVRSAYEHYRTFGRYEGRFPRFNEASYLSKNPDVANAVRNRQIRSGYDHWLRYGRFENRQL